MICRYSKRTALPEPSCRQSRMASGSFRAQAGGEWFEFPWGRGGGSSWLRSEVKECVSRSNLIINKVMYLFILSPI